MLYCPSCGTPISTSNSCFCGSPLQPTPIRPMVVTSNGPPNMAGWQAERLRLLEEEHRAAVTLVAALGDEDIAWDETEQRQVLWLAAVAAIPEER